MRRMQQPLLPGMERLALKSFGGSLLKGNPREARPLSLKRPLHLVLRSSHARGSRSFLQPVRARKIEAIVRTQAWANDIRVYRLANGGNHLHILMLAKSRARYLRFIRSVTGLIARATLGAERGSPQEKKFWDARPFTRIVEWGREFRAVSRYVLRNTLEAIGFIPFARSKDPPGFIQA